MLVLIRRLARRAALLLHRREREAMMDDEMRFHIEMEAAELRRSGLTATEADRQARIAFGGVERFKEEGRDARGTRLLEDLAQDVRYGLRQLRASPGFAAATVLTLALGIGATTTLASYRRYINSQETTLAAPERLVVLGEGRRECVRCARLSPAGYRAIRDRARTIERASLWAGWAPILRGPERTEALDGFRVTTGFFQLFDIPALLGRTIVAEDSAPDRRDIVVLSEQLWRTRFGGDSAVVGTVVILDGTPLTIVGVVASTKAYPRDANLWTPLTLTRAEAAQARPGFRSAGRLADGAAVTTASAELALIAGQLTEQSPREKRSTATLSATSFADLGKRDGDAQTGIIMAAMWMVLLIACLNLAGLLVARLSARRRELAVRRALGAAPVRIVRQLLVEILLIAGAGGVCGAILAMWALGALIGWPDLHIDLREFATTLAMGLLSGLVIGLWPAWRATRPTLEHELRNRAGGASVDMARGRRALVVAEVALAIVLLTAAGQLARSFWKMSDFAPGFRAEQLLVLRVRGAPNAKAAAGRADRIAEAIEALPAVERAGAALGVPFGHGWGQGTFELDGSAIAVAEERSSARMQASSPGYFAALGIPILRGRAFTDADRAGAPRVAIVNQAFAERFLPGEDPVGRAVAIDSVRWEIVGVTATVFTGNFDELVAPEIHRPAQQWEQPQMWIAARTRGDPSGIGEGVMAAVRRIDPDLAITRLTTMSALRDNDMRSERQMLRMMAGFAVAAMFISAIGLYGLISYSVAQRTREFGVRLALGATTSAVLKLVLIQGMRPAVIGVAVGIAGAIGATQVMRSILFRVSPADPLTLGAVTAAICAIALFAAWLPARRAMRVDPMTSLRED